MYVPLTTITRLWLLRMRRVCVERRRCLLDTSMIASCATRDVCAGKTSPAGDITSSSVLWIRTFPSGQDGTVAAEARSRKETNVARPKDADPGCAIATSYTLVAQKPPKSLQIPATSVQLAGESRLDAQSFPDTGGTPVDPHVDSASDSHSVTGADHAEATAQIGRNVAAVREQINAAALRSGRSPADICLLPVTKYHPESQLRAIHSLGFRDLGENRIQELRAKAAAMSDLDINWVLIGHLQTNKATQAARVAKEIQSVDSLRVATALSNAVVRLQNEDAAAGEDAAAAPLKVLLQVNTSGEEAKYGLAPNEVGAVLEQVADLPGLTVGGFMTMAPLTDDEGVVRQTFSRLRELRDTLVRASGLELPELSMGMSHDFEIAIEEGATTVRIGSSIFGPRL